MDAVIEKVISLGGVGLLVKPLPAGALELAKTVAIYSDNGRGKSTFACVCRSLGANDCSELTARRTLGSTSLPKAEFLVQGKKHTLANGAWDQPCAVLRVFDSHFIEHNVCSGSSVLPAHRESLLEFALGEEGTRLKAEIDGIAERIKEANEALRNLRALIEPQVTPFAFEDFLRLPDESPDEAEIALAENALRDARNAAAIAARPECPTLELPMLDVARIERVLSSSVETMGNEAERLVRAHLRDHLDEHGEAWLRQGLGYMSDGECPFCGRDTDKLDLVEAYRTFFSERYEQLNAEILEIRKQVLSALSDSRLDELARAIGRLGTASGAWSDRPLTFPVPPQDSVEVCREVRTEVLRLLDEKSASPLEPHPVDEAAEKALASLGRVKREVDEYHSAALRTNSEIAGIKATVGAVDLRQLGVDRERLEARKRRSVLAGPCKDFTAAIGRKQQLEREKSSKRGRLTRQTKVLLDDYCNAINARLTDFGADFRLVKMTRSDAAGTPRASYAISLNQHEIPLVDAGNAPDFSTTLSDGDRRLLAFAFFLARLDAEASISALSIVLDDPVCSFDIYRRGKAAEAVLSLVERDCQVIVLSHDPDFIRLLRDRGFERVLQLRKGGKGCVFQACDIDEICESEYVGHYRELCGYLSDGRPSEKLRNVAKCIRPYLETNLRHRFPVELVKQENLGKMIGAIKNSGGGSGLVCLMPRLPDLERINNYASPFHHDEDEKPVERELRQTVELALELGRG